MCLTGYYHLISNVHSWNNIVHETKYVLEYPGPRGFLLILSFFSGNLWHKALIHVLSWEKRKPLVKTIGILTFMPSAFDRLFWLEDVFNCSTSHIIGWIKYLWGYDWSKEKDIFDSCQVLSQHESEILNDLDQRLSFLSSQCFMPIKNKRRFSLQNLPWKNKRKPLGLG